jgi:hypothetical protein
MKFFQWLGETWFGKAVKAIAKQLWSPFADRGWDLDPYKIFGAACVIAAIIFASKVIDLANKAFDLIAKAAADAPQIVAVIGPIAGIVGVIATLGTFLFNQARKSDDTLKLKPVEAAPVIAQEKAPE